MRLSVLILALPLVASAQTPAATPPSTVTVTATAIGAAPGAIVCRDMNTVAVMFDWYSEHWEDSMQDRLTNGQSKLVRGPSTQAPVLSRFGCYLAKPGTPMLLERRHIVPVVSFKLSSGKTVRGVTMETMFVESKGKPTEYPQATPTQ